MAQLETQVRHSDKVISGLIGRPVRHRARQGDRLITLERRLIVGTVSKNIFGTVEHVFEVWRVFIFDHERLRAAR